MGENFESGYCVKTPLGPPKDCLRLFNGILGLCLQFRNWGTFRFWCDYFKSVLNRSPKMTKKQRFDTIFRIKISSHIPNQRNSSFFWNKCDTHFYNIRHIASITMLYFLIYFQLFWIKYRHSIDIYTPKDNNIYIKWKILVLILW